MPSHPHFYLHTFLRGLVTATTDEALKDTEHRPPSEVVQALATELHALVIILDDIEQHLMDEEDTPDEHDALQQELNYYAGLEL